MDDKRKGEWLGRYGVVDPLARVAVVAPLCDEERVRSEPHWTIYFCDRHSGHTGRHYTSDSVQIVAVWN